MTELELLETIRAVQRRGTELEDVEVEAASGGTPEELWTALSAFGNRPGGGVLLFGLDPESFQPCGIGDLDQLQRDLASTAALMEPPLGIHFTLVYLGGQPVVGAEVPEVPTAFRPCYYKPRGLHNGAFVRTGDSDRHMTEYEIYLHLSARTQPTEDRTPVEQASFEDLDPLAIDAFLKRVIDRRPTLAAMGLQREDLLRLLNVTAGDRKPTLAGLYGRWSQPA